MAEIDTNRDIEVFYDGACPLCVREIRLLRRLDRRRGRIRFTDIAAEGFEPGSVGLTMDTLMARIYGRLPDGTLVEGVEVFRRLYAAVGFAARICARVARSASTLALRPRLAPWVVKSCAFISKGCSMKDIAV